MFEKLKQRFQKKRNLVSKISDGDDLYMDYRNLDRFLNTSSIIQLRDKTTAYFNAITHDTELLEHEMETFSKLDPKDSFIFWCNQYEKINRILQAIQILETMLIEYINSYPDVKEWIKAGQTGMIPEEASRIVPLVSRFPNLRVKLKEAAKFSELIHQLYHLSDKDLKPIKEVYIETIKTMQQLIHTLPVYSIFHTVPLFTEEEEFELVVVYTRAGIRKHPIT